MPPHCPHDEKVSPYVQSQILLFLFQSAVTQFGIISKFDKSTLCHLLQVIVDANHVAGLTPKHDHVTGVTSNWIPQFDPSIQTMASQPGSKIQEPGYLRKYIEILSENEINYCSSFILESN